VSFQDLDTDLLRCFVAVADTKGFTAAGKVVGRTQSAVTIKIQRLEELVDRQLLKRTSRSLSLTEDGELLLGYARRILDLHDEGLLRVTAPRLDGTLHLGVVDHFATERLPLHRCPLAKAFGAEVFATVSRNKHRMAGSLGATPIDYRSLSPTWSRVGLREEDCDYRSRMIAETYSTPGSQIMWFHSYAMWFRGTPYSQLIRFQNRGCCRSGPFMFSGRHT